MGTRMNKKTYEKLINKDIERLEKDMKQCPERDHIKTVLLDSVDKLYNHKRCPKCGNRKVIMFTADMDMCQECGHQFYP